MIRLFADTASNLPVALNKKYNSATDNLEKREIIKEMAQLQQKLKSKNVKDKL